jgi:hypothetical protein
MGRRSICDDPARPPGTLRFSLGRLAYLSIGRLGLLALCAYLTFMFAYHVERLPEGGRSRGQALWDLLRTDGGIPGALLAGIGCCFMLWLVAKAIWRFMADAPLAVLEDEGLRLHRSYSGRGRLAYRDIERIDLAYVGKWRPLAISDSLLIVPKAASGPHRRIRLWSMEVEGGRQALAAFGRELAERIGDERATLQSSNTQPIRDQSTPPPVA